MLSLEQFDYCQNSSLSAYNWALNETIRSMSEIDEISVE